MSKNVQTLSVKIAQCVFGLNIQSKAIHEVLSSAWRAFVTAETPEVDIRVTLSRSSVQTGPREMPQPRLDKSGNYRIETGDLQAVIAADGRSAEVEGSSDRFPIESVVKLVLARRLLEKGGLLVHGIGLAAGENGALFVADSGEGKSTLGEWSVKGGLTRLADELVAVIPHNGGFELHGTPWNIGQPTSTALRLLGTLGWSGEPRFDTASSSLLAPKLLSNTLLFDTSPVGRARVFQASSELLNAVTCVKLYFAPDVSVAGCLSDELTSF